MDKYHNKIVVAEKVVTAIAVLVLLSSCAQFFATSKQKAGSIVKVGEGIYRGPRLGDLTELQSLKIRTILNLENDAGAVQRESETAKQLGITIIHIPMSNIFRPGRADLLRAEKILEDEKCYPIYVHCKHGRDRTGFVIAAYEMVHHGWTLEDAYKEAVNKGHNTWFYDSILGWKESLRVIASEKISVQSTP